jgi:hypothetical protein
VLLDEALGDDPKHLCPDFTDSVDTEVSRLVKGLVGRGVDGLVLDMEVSGDGDSKGEETHKRVGVVPDSLFAVRGPRTHGVVGVVFRATDGSGQEI